MFLWLRRRERRSLEHATRRLQLPTGKNKVRLLVATPRHVAARRQKGDIYNMGMLIVDIERRLFNSLEFGCGRPKQIRDIRKQQKARLATLSSRFFRALPVIVIVQVHDAPPVSIIVSWCVVRWWWWCLWYGSSHAIDFLSEGLKVPRSHGVDYGEHDAPQPTTTLLGAGSELRRLQLLSED